MAKIKIKRKRKRKRKTPTAKGGVVKEVLSSAGRGAGAGAMGFGHGVVAEAVSERAAFWYRMAGIGAGIGVDAFVDGEESPILKEIGKMSLYGNSSLEGSERGRQSVRAWREYKAERDDQTKDSVIKAEVDKIRERMTALAEEYEASAEELKRRHHEVVVELQRDMDSKAA